MLYGDDQPPPPNRLKFEDLLTPEHKKATIALAQQEKCQKRFEKEVDQVIDAVVRSYNGTKDDEKLKYLGTIDTFQDRLDHVSSNDDLF
jgi:hypothetical protein